MDDSGIIYVLTNPKMSGLVKIGCTTGDVEDRISELSSSTGVPVAFQCHFAAQVKNYAAKEKRLHQLFAENHARVVGGNRVEYDGQTISLSAAALAALHKLGYKTPSASGSDYWMYDGKTLDEIRIAKEAESLGEFSEEDLSG
ncbi:MAG: GIY-YIG nuclease family protein [Candidatus Korobacteraceae bacterium]